MPIQYLLQPSHLTGAPDRYVAHVRVTASFELEAVVDRIIARGSTVTRADVLAVLEDTVAVCEDILIEGGRVNLGGLCQLFPRVKGLFDGLTDTFDPGRHRVDAAAVPGTRLRQTLRKKASLERLPPPDTAPNPVMFHDVTSGTDNGPLTPGGIGAASGNRLKFHPENLDEGVYFRPVSGPETRVDHVQTNYPKKLVFQIPATLIPGPYRLEVRARHRPSSDLRTGLLQKQLQVP